MPNWQDDCARHVLVGSLTITQCAAQKCLGACFHDLPADIVFTIDLAGLKGSGTRKFESSWIPGTQFFCNSAKLHLVIALDGHGSNTSGHIAHLCRSSCENQSSLTCRTPLAWSDLVAATPASASNGNFPLRDTFCVPNGKISIP